MVPLAFDRQGICFVGQCVKKCFLLAWWRDSTEHVILVSSRICSQAQKIPFVADEEVQFVMAPKTRPRVVSLPLTSSRFKGIVATWVLFNSAPFTFLHLKNSCHPRDRFRLGRRRRRGSRGGARKHGLEDNHLRLTAHSIIPRYKAPELI